ncbi:MAG: hypothetical protein ACFFEN_01335 [Candidatus Thorarchaeota archaeon]
MTQAYEEMMKTKSIEIEEVEVQIPEENEIDELLGDLNPRYFEERITLKETKQRAYASTISQNFNPFNPF